MHSLCLVPQSKLIILRFSNFCVLNSVFFAIRLPIEQKSPIGYVVVGGMQIILFVAILYALTCVMGLLLGYFLIGTTMFMDINRKIYEISTKFKADGNFVEIVDRLRDLYSVTVELYELNIF